MNRISQFYLIAGALGLMLWIPNQGMAAKELSCGTTFSFLSFGSQSKDSDAVDLYSQLWTQLGDDISTEVIQKIIEKENPYAIPEGLVLKSESLRDGLHQFEQLLILADKNSLEIRLALLEVLKKRIQESSETKTREDKGKKESVLPGRVSRPKKPELYSIEVDSKGEFLLGGSAGGGMLISTDWKSFRLFPSSHNPSDRVQNFKVSPDGQYVYYTASEDQNRHFYRARIRNEQGQLVKKLEAELWLDRSAPRGGKSWMEGTTFSDDGKYLLTRDDQGLYLLATDKPAPKELKALVAVTSEGLVARFFPGGNEIAVLTKDSIKYFKAEGTTNRPDLKLNWGDHDANILKFKPESFILKPDLKKAFVPLRGFQLVEINLETGVATLTGAVNDSLYPPSLHDAAFVRRVYDIVLDSSGEYLFILSGSKVRPGFFHPSPEDPARVLTFELKTGKVIQENLLAFVVPGSLYYIPNHNALLVDYPVLKEFTILPKNLWKP